MTFHQLYREALQEMPSAFEAGVLFFELCGFPAHELPIRGPDPVHDATVRDLRLLCGRRREGVPLQYLIGRWEFYGLELEVGEGVLIPRPETELLADTAMELLRDRKRPSVLDLCSGSGAIAITLAKHIRAAEVTALEFSDAAFVWLARNNSLHENRVRAVRGDALSWVPPCRQDLITCNPPYIASSELAGLQKEVLHEPVLALDGGTDGLLFYRKLIPHCRRILKEDGILLFEVGIGQSREVADLLCSHGYQNILVRTDLSGIERVVGGYYNENGKRGVSE